MSEVAHSTGFYWVSHAPQHCLECLIPRHAVAVFNVRIAGAALHVFANERMFEAPVVVELPVISAASPSEEQPISWRLASREVEIEGSMCSFYRGISIICRLSLRVGRASARYWVACEHSPAGLL